MSTRDSLISYQAELYERRFDEYGDSAQGVHWGDQSSQWLRFDRLMNPLLSVRPSGFSIHDVGSGVCDLHRYLSERKIVHTYSGTEIVEKMIEQSRRKYPEIQLHQRDLAREATVDRHDFVVLSGTLNLRGAIDSSTWNAHCRELLTSMFAMCDVGIAFNFLSENRTRTDENLAYFKPEEMVSFCLNTMSRFANLDQTYPLYEATVCVFKETALRALYPGREFEKYWTPALRRS